MKHGSLFSGIGGFDLAAEWMGWENVFHCEWMPFPRQVLKYHFPNSISYEDITKTDFTIHRGTIDVLTGGFPCQPYSVAGKRLGKEDERHLWPQMLRAIQEIEPTFVVGENVRGIVNWNGGMVFDEVQADLENAGYEVIPFILPACAVGAPHRRDRVWFIAANTNSGGLERPTSFGRDSLDVERSSELGLTTNTTSIGLCNNSSGKQFQFATHRTQFGLDENATDTRKVRLSTKMENGELERGKRFAVGGKWNAWYSFPTQSPICSGDDGLPSELDGITFSKWRKESIKGYGNAIVPQVAYEIFKALVKSIQ